VSFSLFEIVEEFAETASMRSRKPEWHQGVRVFRPPGSSRKSKPARVRRIRFVDHTPPWRTRGRSSHERRRLRGAR